MRGKSSDDFISFSNYICFKKFKATKQFMITDRMKMIVYTNVIQKKNFCSCHDEFM